MAVTMSRTDRGDLLIAASVYCSGAASRSPSLTAGAPWLIAAVVLIAVGNLTYTWYRYADRT